MSYTAEQEAQLTAWGCPTAAYMSSGGLLLVGIHIRQPHDVLAWLGEKTERDIALVYRYHDDDFGKQGYSASQGSDFHSAFERDWGDAGICPDPYAATFALAQAVMEAQERDDEQLLVADDRELADMRDLEEPLQQDDGPNGLEGDW